MNFNEFIPEEEQTIATAAEQYTFETGTPADYANNADDLEKELAAPKQVYDQPEDDGEEISDTPATAVRARINAAVNKTTAEILVKNVDRLLSFVMGMVLKEGYEGADSEELSELSEAWALVLPENKPVPPWVNATISTVFIYGLKISSAVKYNRAQKALEKQQEIILQQQIEIEEMRKKVGLE